MGNLRHRQLLVSLKYATIEACFSVPMLQLTLGHMPFTIGFAIEALGWGAAGVGFLAATPFLAAVVQVPISLLLQRRLSLHTIVRIMFVGNAGPWLLVVLFPFIDPNARDVLFSAIVLVSAVANAVSAVSWSASMSELVPLSIRGRYFGRRNLIYGFWSLVAVLVAGQVAERAAASLGVFGAIFAAAAVSRLVGLYFFSRMTFPQVVTSRQTEPVTLRGFSVPLADRNFLTLVAFNGLFGLCLFMGMPFYSVFVLGELSFGLGDLAIMTTVSSLAGLLSVNTWGPLMDRFGIKPVMIWTVILWTTIASALWLLTGPERRLLAYPSFAVMGFMWTLVQLLQFNMMLKMALPSHRTYYISTYYAITNVMASIGPLIGGRLLTELPVDWGTLFGHPLTRTHAVLVGSLALCLASLLILLRVREPNEGSLRDMVRHMGSRADLNPFLMLVSAAQDLFGGRAFEVLLRDSQRALRRHTNVLLDVGAELAQGGVWILRWLFSTIVAPFRRRTL